MINIPTDDQVREVLSPSQIHAADLIPHGWSVAVINGVPQDVAPSDFDVSKLKPCLLLLDKRWVPGHEMRKRAVEMKEKCYLGLSDGKRMLAEQKKISAEFNDFHIQLPGTVMQVSLFLYIAHLRRYIGHWYLRWHPLSNGYGVVDDRLAFFE